MFLSNNSSTTSLNNNIINNCIDQQPMFDKPIFINDVSPNSKMYPPLPIHDQYSFSSFHQNPNSSAADDQDFINIAALLQQHQDLLVGQFSSQLSNNLTTTTTTSTSSSFSKQTGITTTTTTNNDHHHDQTLPTLNNINNNNNMIKNVVVVDGGRRRDPPAAVILNWKRSSTTTKKDRHSKIVTAQGPRDRRMRLSLEIARRFFTLQDMLGFDKASKTVEWLLTKSKGAIKELTRSFKLGSSNNTSGVSSVNSECEVASAFDHTTTTTDINVDDNHEDYENSKVQIINNCTISSINPKAKQRVVKVTHHQRKKPAFHPPPLGKDSRAKARARARERTIEKMRMSTGSTAVPYLQGGNIHNINQLRASSYGTGGEESGSHHQSRHNMMRSTSLEMMVEVEDNHPAAASAHSLECQGRLNIGEECSFVITRNSTSTTPVFDYCTHEIKTSQQGLNLICNNNNNCNFTENWDIDSGRAHSTYYSMANSMHLSTTDFQFVSKPWIT